ncbi:hypothetical protein AKJ16_DCAP02000 [Drosera capensis]
MIPTQDQSRVFHDFSRTLITILRSPSPSSSPPLRYDDVAVSVPSMKPAGLASLMLGISMGMMVCGSVTFVIGFMLMPWVLGLMMLVVLVGVVSGVSVIGRWVVESCTNRKDYARGVCVFYCSDSVIVEGYLKMKVSWELQCLLHQWTRDPDLDLPTIVLQLLILKAIFLLLPIKLVGESLIIKLLEALVSEEVTTWIMPALTPLAVPFVKFM